MKKASIILIKILGLEFILAMNFFFARVEASETANAQFLKLGAGARAAGMADAFTSVADDVTAAYWNPAGLAQLTTPEISVMQNNQLVESQYQYVGGAMPFKNHTLAVSI